MCSDVAIRVNNLCKCYQIYDNPRDRMKQFFYPRIHRAMGRGPRNYFREFWALKGVSFEVKRGETIGVIGRNGSGKSTLLQMICGTLSPTSGSVQTNGRIAALLELGSGFNPEFTGRENVYMNASILGLSQQEVDARFDDIVAFADIGEFIDQPVKTYSSGMYLRLAFAVIAHADADILVIDEALAVGDAFFVQKCMRFLRKFMEKGTILFVSHDTGAVINLCNRAIWLQRGIVGKEGEPKEVAEAYLAALYEEQQGQSMKPAVRQSEHNRTDVKVIMPRDMRLDFVNASSFRNDIELFEFSPDAVSFGKGGASIELVQLLDSKSKPLAWVVGGEEVCLSIQCRANIHIFSPIVGFYFKDRLGQTLFGDNTYLTYQFNPLRVTPGQGFKAKFCFRMPILPLGDYSLCVAIAEGTQQEHIQQHWIHDAIVLKSHSTSVSTGLIGIPMTEIKMKVTE